MPPLSRPPRARATAGRRERQRVKLIRAPHFFLRREQPQLIVRTSLRQISARDVLLCVGVPAKEAGHDGIGDFDGARFLFDVLPTILKFHSDKFHQFLDPDLDYRIPDSEYVAEF